MQDKSLITRYEPWFIVGTATIYVIRRLIDEIYRFNHMIEVARNNRMPLATIGRNLAGYDHTLNNNTPLIAGMCLFLLAWYVFHKLAYPRLQQQVDTQQGWLYGGATVLLLLAGTLVYHYLKLHIRYQESNTAGIIGLRVYSLYRKRTVLADAIGLGIVLGMYELAYQYYQFLYRRIAQETTIHFQLVSYLLLGGAGLFALTFALSGYVPPTLWRGGFGNFLLGLGLLIQVMLLQDYMYRHVLPMLNTPHPSEKAFWNTIIDCLLMALPANITAVGGG